ncbi:MAG: hypothetical protein A2583_15690 [Bdellovibrionales bacterium RIFOXYD1_FULL_53_11]|nr:MAG: hypothetical protein A2583_15690 [Bdellovibrionales bacterium RIFOXYD1_FULL_53_11]
MVAIIAHVFAYSIPSAADVESYSSRPDILDIKPRNHPKGLANDWNGFKRSHLEAVAELIELYPDHGLYFLARDGELLYDYARLVAKKTDPALLKRLHLINVSRANVTASGIREYLAQEGISVEALKKGKKILLVDTGFSGTIPDTLKLKFPKNLRKNIATHLMISNNKSYPSSRVFQTSVYSVAAKKGQPSLHMTIIGYEHIARYTDRSTGFRKTDGQWHAISPIGRDSDGVVSRKLARMYMEDLAAFALAPESMSHMSKRRAQWRELMTLLKNGTREQITARLRNMLKPAQVDAWSQAIARDLLESVKLNHPDFAKKLPTPEAIGLAKEVAVIANSNKYELILKNPKWAAFLTDPEGGISRLIKSRNWSTLVAISDVILDEEWFYLLAKKFDKLHKDPEVRKFVQSLIQKKNAQAIHFLINEVFCGPVAPEFEDLIELAIKNGDTAARELFATKLFATQHGKKMHAAMRTLIEFGEESVHFTLAKHVFTDSFRAAGFNQELRMLVERGSEDVLLVLKNSILRNRSRMSINEFDVLREAVQIDNRQRRIEFLSRKLGPSLGMRSLDPGSSGIAAGIALKNGQTVRTKKGMELVIKENINDGLRGMVYMVEDSNGKKYALKVARFNDMATLESIAKEPVKNKLYSQYKVPHARIIEVDEQYVLKEWIDGERADKWLEGWLDRGRPRDEPQIKQLRTLIKDAAAKGIYIGDMHSKNLIWNGKKWIVIDSGGIREGLAVEEAIDQYLIKIPGKWSRRATIECAEHLRFILFYK